MKYLEDTCIIILVIQPAFCTQIYNVCSEQNAGNVKIQKTNKN